MADFELDPYIERLLILRDSDPAAFARLHSEVKRLIEEYEKEKAAAQIDNTPHPDTKESCGK